MKLSRTHKMLIATGATLIAGAVFFSTRAKAGSYENTLTTGNNDGIMVTNHDTIYDYKYSGGIWYSRKKGATSWINLKNALTTEKYALAESRLKKYI